MQPDPHRQISKLQKRCYQVHLRKAREEIVSLQEIPRAVHVHKNSIAKISLKQVKVKLGLIALMYV